MSADLPAGQAVDPQREEKQKIEFGMVGGSQSIENQAADQQGEIFHTVRQQVVQEKKQGHKAKKKRQAAEYHGGILFRVVLLRGITKLFGYFSRDASEQ